MTPIYTGNINLLLICWEFRFVFVGDMIDIECHLPSPPLSCCGWIVKNIMSLSFLHLFFFTSMEKSRNDVEVSETQGETLHLVL